MAATPYLLTRRIVRALRLRRGLTQEQLAERAGLDYKYFQRFELGLTRGALTGDLGKAGARARRETLAAD